MISSYYQYPFISPDPLFAKIKEELKSYFEAGVMDDTLFPRWLSDALKDLSKSSLKVEHDILMIEDYQATLPTGFHSVKEAWGTLCLSQTVPLPNAYYETVTRNLSVDYDRCDTTCDPCLPEMIRATYKSTTNVTYEYQIQGLLKPGNINAIKQCGTDCLNIGSSSYDEFDIRGNKFITNFANGTVYIVYYSEKYDDNGYQLVPDAREIEKYIEAYIKFKLFYTLYNTVTDETINQVRVKYQEAKIDKEEAFITASNHTKKETTRRKIEKMKRIQDTYKYYHIP